jgi:hypothetical protein
MKILIRKRTTSVHRDEVDISGNARGNRVGA